MEAAAGAVGMLMAASGAWREAAMRGNDGAADRVSSDFNIADWLTRAELFNFIRGNAPGSEAAAWFCMESGRLPCRTCMESRRRAAVAGVETSSALSAPECSQQPAKTKVIANAKAGGPAPGLRVGTDIVGRESRAFNLLLQAPYGGPATMTRFGRYARES